MLAWTPYTYPSPSDRVSATRTTCGPFVATAYAIESLPQDRFFVDIDFDSPIAGAQNAPYLVQWPGDAKTTGVLDSPAKAERAAALRLQDLAGKMTATLGVVK